MPKEALVVKREDLFRERSFNGFLSAGEYDYLPLILQNYSYHERGDALERDISLKQIIPYVMIINPVDHTILAYKRADKSYSEERLRSKVSIGVGGHVERQDGSNPIESGMDRELAEEVRMERPQKPRIIGYINDDTKGEVEKVHFGIAALVETTGKVEKGDDEMVGCKFYTVPEFEQLVADPKNNLEEWSKIAWPVVKQILLSK